MFQRAYLHNITDQKDTNMENEKKQFDNVVDDNAEKYEKADTYNTK